VNELNKTNELFIAGGLDFSLITSYKLQASKLKYFETEDGTDTQPFLKVREVWKGGGWCL